MNALQKIFRPHSSDTAKNDQIGGTLAKLKGVHEHLADFVEATKELEVLDALKQASPWAEAFGNALGDAIPPVRFVLKLFGELTKVDDPDQLGYLAATLAYQRSVEQAWQAMPEEVRKRLKGVDPQLRRKALKDLRAATPAESYDFGTFAYLDALQSDFLRDAEKFLGLSTEGLGLANAEFLNLQSGIRTRFVSNLKGILSHGSTRERFAPFRDRMTLDTREARAYDALREHADYQRWLFEEQPVLGREPFTLAQVYTETDCGVLRWEEIYKKDGREDRFERVDPFKEKYGGRRALISTVLDLIADINFRDAIVIQGVAGSGKSSSTLRLAWELVSEGLRPIRVELKHIDPRDSRAIDESVPEAVLLTSRERDPKAKDLIFGKDLFLDDAIFKESVLFRGAEICPYVLILDGWDEINISASRGYQQQVERILEAVRRKFLGPRGFPVRVVLAGRPTQAIEASKFLRNDTHVLTVRDFSADQLAAYVEKVKETTKAKEKKTSDCWNLTEVTALPAFLDRYRTARATGSRDLEILGLPLLAHLALRLLAERPGDGEHFLQDTTSLYRNLVDLVVGQAGKPGETDFDGSAMLKGEMLRRLLRGTAEAMTTFGAESISHDELALRLDLDEVEIRRRVDEISGECVLSRLMISFFFRGGRTELGAEFSHKSFREYLFAEQLIEEVKNYGRAAPELLPVRPAGEYWKDFVVGDPRRDFCRRLTELLGPASPAPEVNLHIRRLLVWEIARAGEQPAGGKGLPTASLSREQWCRVRDGLADAWDWWGDGVHLRPQPVRKSGHWHYDHAEKPLALLVVENKRLRSDLKQCPLPYRSTSVDALLGAGLLLLAAMTHAELALRESADRKLPWQNSSERVRRYQLRFEEKPNDLVVFSPSGPDGHYFFNYCARILAGGYRPYGNFPIGAYLRGVDLSWAYLERLDLRGADLRGANLRGAILRCADFRGTYLGEVDFSEANLLGADFRNTDLRRVNLHRASLIQTNLRGADLRQVDLSGACLSGADLSGANLGGANLSGADFRDAIYKPKQLELAILDSDVQNRGSGAS